MQMPNCFPPASLRIRIVLLVTVSVGLVVGGCLWAVVNTHRDSEEEFRQLIQEQISTSLREEWVRKTQAMSSTIAELLIQPVHTLDLFAINKIAESIERQDCVRYIFILDNADRVLGDGAPETDRLGHLMTGYPHTVSASIQIWKDKSAGNVLEVVTPIRLGDQAVGRVVVGFPTAEIETVTSNLYQELAIFSHDHSHHTVMEILISGSVIALIGILFAFFVVRRMTRPIRMLADETRKIRKGNFDVRIEPGGRDELGQLIQSFLRMAEEIRTREDALIRSNVILKEKKAAAEAANQAKSAFLANMSHELRTPLNHIIGFTELVVDDDDHPVAGHQAEFLGDVLVSGRHLLSLINDILDLSKIEAGGMELDRSDVNPRLLIESSVAMVAEKARRNSICIETRCDGIPETVAADERKIKQVMINLLANAVKFTPEQGVITVTARTIACRVRSGKRRDDPTGLQVIQAPDTTLSPCIGDDFVPKPCLAVSVSDTGIGIHPDDQSRIFEPFCQADNSSSRRFQGTGLGLTLSRQLIELHGGRLWVESDGEGYGSTFSFMIPIERIEERKSTPMAAGSESKIVGDLSSLPYPMM